MTADDIWKNDALMAINAELGLPMWKFTVIVNRIAEMEREECAKLCEKYERMCSAQSDKNPWRYAAGAIRARAAK